MGATTHSGQHCGCTHHLCGLSCDLTGEYRPAGGGFMQDQSTALARDERLGQLLDVQPICATQGGRIGIIETPDGVDVGARYLLVDHDGRPFPLEDGDIGDLIQLLYHAGDRLQAESDTTSHPPTSDGHDCRESLAEESKRYDGSDLVLGVRCTECDTRYERRYVATELVARDGGVWAGSATTERR